MVPKDKGNALEERPFDKVTDSENWAEHRVLLVVEQGTPSLTSLHSDALQSPLFLLKLTDFLGQNPTAKHMILSPFQSHAFPRKTKAKSFAHFFLPARPNTDKTGSIWCAAAIPSEAQNYWQTLSCRLTEAPHLMKAWKNRSSPDFKSTTKIYGAWNDANAISWSKFNEVLPTQREPTSKKLPCNPNSWKSQMSWVC